MNCYARLLLVFALPGCSDKGAGDGPCAAEVECPNCDDDGDGVTRGECDCDDTDRFAAGEDAGEFCDGHDNDCDGEVDEGVELTLYEDRDGDGFGDPDASWLGCEADRPDAYVAAATDCDDLEPQTWPGAPETCNEVDDDCDGDVDEDVTPTWYTDGDGDGFGSAEVLRCEQPAGTVAEGGDCDDEDAAVSPAATEICNGLDDDCDGVTDEADAADAATWYPDADGDGYGDPSGALPACDAPDGYLADATDCDDADPDAWPGAPEAWDGVDTDCDGELDLLDLDEAVATCLRGGASQAVGSQQRLLVADVAGADLAADVPGADGLPDLVVASDYYYGEVWVMSGADAWLGWGDEPLDLVAAATVEGLSTYEHLSGLGTVPGDLSGDLVADLVVLEGYDPLSEHTGWVFAGGSALSRSLATTDAATTALDSYDACKFRYNGLASATTADVDGDGNDDLVLGYSTSTWCGAMWTDMHESAGRIAVHMGPLPDGAVYLTGADYVLLGETAFDHLGSSLTAADLDGDGHPEVVAGASGWSSSGDGAVYVLDSNEVAHWTGDTPGSADVLALVTGSGAEGLGGDGSLVESGDNDDGGTADLAIGSSSADTVYLLRGEDGLSGSIAAADATWTFSGDGGTSFGDSLATTADLNGDGLDDVLVGAPAADVDGLAEAGQVYLFDSLPSGGGSLSAEDATLTIRGEEEGWNLGSGLDGGADLDGDGVEDAILGASGWSSATERKAGVACVLTGR